MDRAVLTRTGSGYRAIKQADSSDFVPSDPPKAVMARPQFTGITPLLIYTVYVVTLGPLLFGYHLGELNAPQKVITCQLDKIPGFVALGLPQCIPMNTFQWGTVQAMFTVGGFFGAIFTGAVATNYGRLFAIKWAAFFLAGGPIAEALAGKMWVLALGRALSGIGAGAATVVCPLYIAEVSPQKKRGLFGAFTQVQINSGIVVSQLLGYFLSRSDRWRWILASGGFIAGFMFFGLTLTPETPKWLAANNRPRMARGILQRLRGKNAEIREEMETWDVSGEAEEESLLGPPQGPRPQKPANKSMLDVIRIPKYRRAVVAVTGTMMAQQLCGINSVVMYSVAILGKIMPKQAGLITVLVSAVNVLVTALASPLPDYIGRKPCLLMSISGMGSASAMLFAGLEEDIQWLTIVAITLFVASFGVGLGPVPFILTSELVGPEAVGAVSSWALASNWLSTFLVSMFFPALNNALGNRVWWIFAGIAGGWAAFVGAFVPESKGKANADEVWGRARHA
ncbi:Bifunctional purine biosynthesis protein PurH [Cladophialophora chaetospira]|uniref:Bifunctional purine biosynthesis protein PurH n=1 Tax=Cladophialophora chaetospira TaxID=386627 RepID=A0AA39CF45_9EURO|nr:Bifunctional purine biosynthesis protein PurH [Cladophialophora chaetospira]